MINIAWTIFKKAWSLLAALVILITGFVEYPPAIPIGADLIDYQNIALDKALLRGQGLTTDGTYFYHSGNYFLSKSDMKTNEYVEMNLMAIPFDIMKTGGNHIGGISYYDGKIYAPIEDGSDYLHPFIAIFDAETLKFTGTYYELPWELHKEGVPWCAVDAPRGYLYTMEWSDATVLNVFNLNDMSLVKTVPLSETMDRIQGAEVYDGMLYMSCDNRGDEKYIYVLNPVTGAVKVAFSRNVGEDVEAEDMTVYPMADGSLFHVTDVAPWRINVMFRHYYFGT